MAKEHLIIPFEIKANDVKEDGTFSGFSSLFDQTPDAHRDLVARGAFMETLAAGGRNGTGIALLWSHDIRQIPAGVWLELRETPRGLFCKGQLALNTQLGSEIHSIMLLGAQTGTYRLSLSIGYDSIEEEYQTVKIGDADVKVRLLKKVSLWEISICNFPAKLGTTITDVKYELPDPNKISPIEGGGRYEFCRKAMESFAAPDVFAQWEACLKDLENLREEAITKHTEMKNAFAQLEEKCMQVIEHKGNSFDAMLEVVDESNAKIRAANARLEKFSVDLKNISAVRLENRILELSDMYRKRSLSRGQSSNEETTSAPTQEQLIRRASLSKQGIELGSDAAKRVLLGYED